MPKTLRIVEFDTTVTRDDELLRLSGRDQYGGVHIIEIMGRQASDTLLSSLLTSKFDPLAPESRQFAPMGAARFRPGTGEDRGLSLILQPQSAIHLSVDRRVAAAIARLLSTFDDPATWETPHGSPERPN